MTAGYKIKILALFLRVMFLVSFLTTTGYTEIVEGCIDSNLNLSCGEMKTINITSIVLGDSSCWKTNCCPKHDSCTQNITDSQVNEVKSRCNGRHGCAVGVTKQRISCGTFGSWSNNDFERIAFDCIEEPGARTMQHYLVTVAISRTILATDSAKEETDLISGMNLVIIIASIIVFIVISLFVVSIAKNKKSWSKLECELEMSSITDVSAVRIDPDVHYCSVGSVAEISEQSHYLIYRITNKSNDLLCLESTLGGAGIANNDAETKESNETTIHSAAMPPFYDDVYVEDCENKRHLIKHADSCLFSTISSRSLQKLNSSSGVSDEDVCNSIIPEMKTPELLEKKKEINPKDSKFDFGTTEGKKAYANVINCDTDNHEATSRDNVNHVGRIVVDNDQYSSPTSE